MTSADWTANIDSVVSAIEMRVGDVCEGLSGKDCWEETFHLAHDYLIDNRYGGYGPETNEQIALAVADKMFPNTKEE